MKKKATAKMRVERSFREVTAQYWTGHGKHKIYFNNVPFARRGERVSYDLVTKKAYGKDVKLCIEAFSDFIAGWEEHLGL